MAILKTAKGKDKVIVDANMVSELSKYNWYKNKEGYIYRLTYKSGKSKAIRIHRHILNPKPGSIVDHVNRNKLDNRRKNLRVVSLATNGFNRNLNKNNTTGCRGVFLNPIGRWISVIRFKGKFYRLGTFGTKKEAAAAYRGAAVVFHGIKEVRNVPLSKPGRLKDGGGE